MPYATREDIEKVYGAQLVQIIADLTEDGVAEDAAIAAALEEASSEIDSYIGVKYAALPLDPIPKILTMHCRDMAVYRLALNSGARTTEMRVRYEDAIKFLERVAAGKVTLIQVAGDLDGDGDVDADDNALVEALKRPYVVRTTRGN